MKKIMVLLMVLVNLFLLCSCSPVQYNKTDLTQISIPDNLDKAFKSTNIEQIEWYLAASKDWEYTKTRRKLMAQKNISKPGNETYAKVTVFTQGLFKTGYSDEPTQTIDSTSENVDVNLYKIRRMFYEETGSELYFSSVTIKFSDKFFVRFNEYSSDKERNMTVNAINDLFKLFDNRAAQEKELHSDGSISSEYEFLEIDEDMAGTHDVFGFVHLSKKNSCRIKVVDAATKEVYFDQLADGVSAFCIGWSDNENDYFFFFQNLTIRKKSNGKERADVIVQLWVDDEDGSRCVLENLANIKFWVR